MTALEAAPEPGEGDGDRSRCSTPTPSARAWRAPSTVRPRISWASSRCESRVAPDWRSRLPNSKPGVSPWKGSEAMSVPQRNERCDGCVSNSEILSDHLKLITSWARRFMRWPRTGPRFGPLAPGCADRRGEHRDRGGGGESREGPFPSAVLLEGLDGDPREPHPQRGGGGAGA